MDVTVREDGTIRLLLNQSFTAAGKTAGALEKEIHEWNVDFPHLMLRAKAKRHRDGESTLAAKVLSSTTAIGRLASIPVVVDIVNASNRAKPMRALLDKTLGVHPDARLPTYHSDTARRRLKHLDGAVGETMPAGRTRGKVMSAGQRKKARARG